MLPASSVYTIALYINKFIDYFFSFFPHCFAIGNHCVSKYKLRNSCGPYNKMRVIVLPLFFVRQFAHFSTTTEEEEEWERKEVSQAWSKETEFNGTQSKGMEWLISVPESVC